MLALGNFGIIVDGQDVRLSQLQLYQHTTRPYYFTSSYAGFKTMRLHACEALINIPMEMNCTIKAPARVVKRGRRSKKARKEAKVGVICSNCKQHGHNKKTCTVPPPNPYLDNNSNNQLNQVDEVVEANNDEENFDANQE